MPEMVLNIVLDYIAFQLLGICQYHIVLCKDIVLVKPRLRRLPYFKTIYYLHGRSLLCNACPFTYNA